MNRFQVYTDRSRRSLVGRWRRLIFTLGLCVASGSSLGAEAPTVTLTGIARVAGQPKALLEFTYPKRPALRPILSEGERIETVEIVSIDDTTGHVTVLQDGRQVVLSIPPIGESFNFRGISFDQIFDIYQEVAKVTILRSPFLVQSKISFQSAAPASAEAARQALDSVLREHGVMMKAHGGLFAFAVPPAFETNLADIIARLGPVPEGIPGGTERFPAGLLKFTEADLAQALDVYQELTGRTLLRTSLLAPFKVTVRSQTSLTRRQAIYMLDATFALGGVAMVPRDERFVFAVDASAVPLLNEVPIQRKLAPSDATTKVPAAELKLSEVDLKTALSVYGGLTGRVPLALDTVPNVKLWYRSQTELTRAEAIYALDSLVAINNIAFEWVDDRAVKAVPRPVFRSQRK